MALLLGGHLLPVPAVGPDLLLRVDCKINKHLIENEMNLAAWWAGISSWLREASCLEWKGELARR